MRLDGSLIVAYSFENRCKLSWVDEPRIPVSLEQGLSTNLALIWWGRIPDLTEVL
jgi:hypothetical protein